VIRLSCPEEFDFSSDLLQNCRLLQIKGGFPEALVYCSIRC
jgi:hypothetical protein